MIHVIVGTIIGAGIGYVIGKFMSRLGMGCPLLCDPRVSTIYFAIMGFLFASGN
jgi:tetrahydromethanopterin S-methyltransferase subunit C